MSKHSEEESTTPLSESADWTPILIHVRADFLFFRLQKLRARKTLLTRIEFFRFFRESTKIVDYLSDIRSGVDPGVKNGAV